MIFYPSGRHSPAYARAGSAKTGTAALAVIPAEAGIHDVFMKILCAYILASKPNGTPSVGVTPNIIQLTWIPASAGMTDLQDLYNNRDTTSDTKV